MVNLITDHIDIWTSAQTQKTNGAGRGNHSVNHSLHGIKKLRELILDLAVRGKLVSQDPNDESASVLLEKIAKAKIRLIKEGKLQKQEPLPEITDDEKPFDLPHGWECTRLGDVIKVIRGITFPASEKSRTPEKGRVACLRTTNVQDKIEWDDLLFIREQFVKRDEQFIQENDIVISMANSRELVGKVAIVDHKPDYHTSFGGFLGVLRTNRLDPFYIMLLLRVQTNRILLIDSANQTTNIANISSAKLNTLILAVPPLAEQQRIVAKVDELMVICDQLEQQQAESNYAHQTLVETLLAALTIATNQDEFIEAWQRIANHFDTLLTTEKGINQLKQTILQLAVMGKLVPQDSNDEPANVLLEKIAKEKARLIKEGKIKKQEPLTEINEDDKLFVLPKGWELSRLQTIIDVRDGTHDSPKDAIGPDTYPLVTSKNFYNGMIRFDEARRISSEDHLEISKRSLVEKYDILFSMIGGNLGNQVIVDDDRPFSVKNVALFKYYNKKLTSPFYIKKFMEHLALDLQSKAAGGAQPFVSLGFLRNLVIAVPPIKEQHRIVAKVDELMALCDTLKTRVKEAQTTQIQLADAIVEQAVA